jgi:hypothetical protein
MMFTLMESSGAAQPRLSRRGSGQRGAFAEEIKALDLCGLFPLDPFSLSCGHASNPG